MNNFIKITIPVSFVLLVLLEIVLRFIPVEDPYKSQKLERSGNKYTNLPSHYLPNQKYTFESKEGLPDLDTSTQFTTNNYGFRGNELKEKKVGTCRIFLMGGSTTECMFMDDKKAPHTLMQNQLSDFQVEVFNTAKAGDMTVEHLSMLVHRVTHLQPDLIVLFCGFNDLRRSHNFDYTHIDSIAIKQEKKGSFKTDLKFFLSNFQIVRRVHNSIKPPSLETIQWTTDFRKKIGQVTSLPNMITRPKINLKAYETNLNSFIGICLRQRIKLVLVTQASTWNSKIDPEVHKLHWLTTYGNVKCSETVLDTLLEKYNNVMRNIAASSDILLYDLAKQIPKSREFFFDDCHFNNKGARFYADSLSAFIRENILTTRINQTTKN